MKVMVIETSKGTIACSLATGAANGVTNTIANFEQKANSGAFEDVIFIESGTVGHTGWRSHRHWLGRWYDASRIQQPPILCWSFGCCPQKTIPLLIMIVSSLLSRLMPEALMGNTPTLARLSRGWMW